MDSKKSDGTCKLVQYDLDTTKTGIKQFKEFQGAFGRLKAYNQFKAALRNEGFEDYQKSIMISKMPMTQKEAIKAVKRVRAKLPWLDKCVDKIGITKATPMLDITYIFKGNDKQRKYSRPEKASEGDPAATPPPSPSNGAMPLDGWKTEIAAMREKSELAKPRSPAKQLDKKSKVER